MTKDLDMSRAADLHYAYQCGQDAAKNDYHAIRAELASKAADDPESWAQFELGYQEQLARMRT